MQNINNSKQGIFNQNNNQKLIQTAQYNQQDFQHHPFRNQYPINNQQNNFGISRSDENKQFHINSLNQQQFEFPHQNQKVYGSKVKDDQQLIDEIEKTIQGLLNLNIIDNLSENQSNFSENDVTCRQICDANKAEHHSSNGVISSSYEDIETTNENSADSNLFKSVPKNDHLLIDLKMQDMQFVQNWTAKIIKQIEDQGVQDLEQLRVLLQQCLNAFQCKFSNLITNHAFFILGEIKQKINISQENKIECQSTESDNIKLKRAVKILYGRLQQYKHQFANVESVIQQNNKLQQILNQKDQQIMILQQELNKMKNIVQIVIQNQQMQSQDSHINQFQGFRDGDAF